MRSQRRYFTSLLLILVTLSIIYHISVKLLEQNDTTYDDLESNDRFKVDLDYVKSIEQIRLESSLKTTSTGLVKPKHLHLLEYIDFPTRVEPYDFSGCRMSNCFDFSRCEAETLKVHILPQSNGFNATSQSGENNIIHRSILDIVKKSLYYEPDPTKACLFILEEDTLDRDPLSQSFRPNLRSMFRYEDRYGMNHIIFNLYSGSWPDYDSNDFSGIYVGAAMLAKASSSLHDHRPGFDIALPLFSYLHPLIDTSDNQNESIDILHRDRKYLLSFKGKRYVIGRGSETRNSLYHLHNDKDVLILSTCRHGKRWQDSIDERCSIDESNYNKYDFVDLMKESTFCLTPRGRRLGSYRFLEALSYGCIPVILSNNWIKPFDELIDWSNATLQFDERLVLQVPDMLRDISPKQVMSIRENGRLLYKRYLASIERIILTSLSIVENRIKRQVHLL